MISKSRVSEIRKQQQQNSENTKFFRALLSLLFSFKIFFFSTGENILIFWTNRENAGEQEKKTMIEMKLRKGKHQNGPLILDSRSGTGAASTARTADAPWTRPTSTTPRTTTSTAAAATPATSGPRAAASGSALAPSPWRRAEENGNGMEWNEMKATVGRNKAFFVVVL